MAVYFQTEVAVSAGTSGPTAWIPMDIHQNPFSVSFFINRISGGGDGTCRVEHTHVNVMRPTSGQEVSVRSHEIFRHEDASAVAVSADGNYAFPIRAMRFFSISGSGQQSFQYTAIQGDGR